jgi:hypothetical protein
VIGEERLERLRRDREKAMQHIYYNILPGCPTRHTLISLIPQNCVPYDAPSPNPPFCLIRPSFFFLFFL